MSVTRMNGVPLTEGRSYYLSVDGKDYAITTELNRSMHTLSRVEYHANGSVTLIPVDHWYNLPDAVQGARADAQES